MRGNVTDAARLNDILQAAAVAEFIRGHTQESYDRNLLLRSAVERQIEVVGEACPGISASLQNAHPEIPWKKIISTRHILAHDYGMIKNDIIWKVATVYLPELAAQVRPLASRPPASPPDDQAGT